MNAAWDNVRRNAPYIRYMDFAAALTLLYATGLVDTDADYAILRKTL